MDLTGQLAFESFLELRKSDRRDVTLGGNMRKSGAHSVTVDILDLSVTGFRVETHLDVAPGSDLWLKLPGLESLHARVVWRRGPMLGGEFVQPLHPAVLDMIVRKAGGQ